MCSFNGVSSCIINNSWMIYRKTWFRTYFFTSLHLGCHLDFEFLHLNGFNRFTFSFLHSDLEWPESRAQEIWYKRKMVLYPFKISFDVLQTVEGCTLRLCTHSRSFSSFNDERPKRSPRNFYWSVYRIIIDSSTVEEKSRSKITDSLTPVLVKCRS